MTKTMLVSVTCCWCLVLSPDYVLLLVYLRTFLTARLIFLFWLPEAAWAENGLLLAGAPPEALEKYLISLIINAHNTIQYNQGHEMF